MNKLTKYFTYYLILTIVSASIYSCGENSSDKDKDETLSYPNLLNVTCLPSEKLTPRQGYFTDRGSWMGFALPPDNSGMTGFCGPVDLDHRKWISQSLFNLSITDKNNQAMDIKQDSAIYYPGKLVMSMSAGKIKIDQELYFISANHTLYRCTAPSDVFFEIKGTLNDSVIWDKDSEGLIASLPGGEVLMINFPNDIILESNGSDYSAKSKQAQSMLYMTVSYFNTKEDYQNKRAQTSDILANADTKIKENRSVWSKYITDNINENIDPKYRKVMVKSIMTLMSNWRSAKGGLLHDGIVPSHAMSYFVGFWAWDSWKHAVALSFIDTALAKDQIRTMFDYQDQYGMIADCVYTDPAENNYRDSKPPLAAWAVDAIYKADNDTAFLSEMYPKLLKYYEWWYQYRDHNKNGICEYGATDGTLEAAKWESGMDNAIRFDNTRMLQNSASAWSMDQESVDLNVYLKYEYQLLAAISKNIGQTIDPKYAPTFDTGYFFDKESGYFFDKTLKGELIKEYGSEGWSPLWTGVATKEQAEQVVKVMADTAKFSTYIPFPTAAADNPKFMPRGYWRGPIWLDQVYFAISGLRKYGYVKEADKYTLQVFDRLQGLLENEPIHENYDVHTGERLKAAHFSWSAAHLFLMYKEYAGNAH